MAIQHVKDGADFFGHDAGHDAGHRSFGFHGSVGAPAPTRGGSPPYASSEPTAGPKRRAEPGEMGEQAPSDYATGGGVHHHPHGHHVVRSEPHHAGGTVHHHAHGGMTIEHADGHVTHHHHDGKEVHAAEGGSMHHMHPHGHHIVKVEHHADGRVVHHHAHGGHTVHHMDGRITHHHEDGSPVHMMHGGMEHMHDPEGEYVHRAHGGSMGEEKALVRKGIRQHESHEHGGEHTDLHLRRGGVAMGERVRLPRGMRPPAERTHSPVNTPPRNPNLTTTPRNAMPGGEMSYGVEPSAEPDMAGSTQGIPQMNRGGRARHRE